MNNTGVRTSGNKLERDFPGDAHALMELGDFKASDERADLVGRAFLHFYTVRGGRGTKQKFVCPGEGAIGRVFPKVTEECLIARLDASKANFIDSLRGERPGVFEDRRQQSVFVGMRFADDNPVQRPVSF